MGTKMATKKNDTKATLVVRAKQLVAGTQAKLASTPSIMLANVAITPAELVTRFNRVVTLREEVDAAKAATRGKLAAEAAEMPALRALMSAFVDYLEAAHRGDPEFLAAFGIVPTVRAKPTAETKAAAAVKRASTRGARHTMGPLAKQAVKGDVTGVTLVPLKAASPTVTPATPAGPGTGAPAPAATGQPAQPAGGSATPVTPATPAPHGGS